LELEKQKETKGTQVVGWNPAAMSQEDKQVAMVVCSKQVMKRANLGAEGTGDMAESEAAW